MDEWLLGELKTNFSIFILGGLMIVIGATWAIMYNADILLGALERVARALPPHRADSQDGRRVSAAKRVPDRVALAMFTLVVFTLVVGAITTGSFQNGFNDLDEFGGGFHVRATTSPVSPLTAMETALASSGLPLGLRARVEPVLPAGRRTSGGFRFRDVCRQGPRFRVPSEHDLPACCPRAGLRVGRGCLACAR